MRTLSQYMAKQKGGVTGVRIASRWPRSRELRSRYRSTMCWAPWSTCASTPQANIDPARIGFVGNSAGAHLAAVGAMRTPGAKAFVRILRHLRP